MAHCIAFGFFIQIFAQGIFQQIEGFGEYGFPESHAASFALLVWVSCWLKRHEPAAFLAAMLNSQPLGFYTPSQLVQDARRHDLRRHHQGDRQEGRRGPLPQDGQGPVRTGQVESPPTAPLTNPGRQRDRGSLLQTWANLARRARTRCR
mgnify:CR=1 FL=1